jgi:hypothetical protein
MRLNSTPAPATDLTPADMQGLTSASPLLSHTNSVDGEGDVITYSYEIYTDAQMGNLVEQISDHPSGSWTTSYQMSTTLDDDATYYWRVRGSDPYEDGQWTDLVSFWVNSDNSLPTAFDLVSPADGASLGELNTVLIWTASSDTDPYDQIGYTLYYSTDPDFANKTTVTDLDSTSYTLGSLAYGNTYYWKVVAEDMFGGQTYCSETFSFSTISRGDANGDGEINVADAVFLINFVFNEGPAPDPLESGDANCDSNPNVGDAVYLINYVFGGGPEPGCN